jgi:hypothetical protein
MLHNSFRLFTIRGIEVGVHYSWLIIFLLLTWSLSIAVFPDLVPGASTAEHWVLGVIAALLLFVSVLIHELAHSFVGVLAAWTRARSRCSSSAASRTWAARPSSRRPSSWSPSSAR